MRSIAFSTTRSGKRPSRIDLAVRSLMPPMIAGVVVIDLVLALAAGQHGMRRIDDDDVVADRHGAWRSVMLPRRRMAISEASADHQTLASISTHFFVTSAGLAENVFM